MLYPLAIHYTTTAAHAILTPSHITPMHTSTYAMIALPLLAIIAAQTVKFVRLSIRHGLDWGYLLSTGHMPSAHSAFVSALVTAVGWYDGMGTGAFAVAAGFAIITIYDALRVRMQIGQQGKFLNELVKELPNLDRGRFPRLKEHVGHYTSEVLAGIVFGTAVATAGIVALGFAS